MSMIAVYGGFVATALDNPTYHFHYALYLSPIPNDDGANLWVGPHDPPPSWIFMSGNTTEAFYDNVSRAKLLQMQRELRTGPYSNRGASSRGGQSLTRPFIRTRNGNRAFDSTPPASRLPYRSLTQNPIQFWALFGYADWANFHTYPFVGSLDAISWDLGWHPWADGGEWVTHLDQ
jgi:hypothetical protein